MSAPAKVAVVTAASRGMGAACARLLAARGYSVSLLARSTPVVELAAQLGGIATVGSLLEPASLERLVQSTIAHFGRIDVLVNNAGHPAKGELLELSDGDWQEGFEMLLLSVIRLSRLVTPTMVAQRSGSIVNISSLWAVEPHLDAPISSTLRAALSAFTKLYADRYAGSGIRMNSILPGFVDTYPVPEKFRRAIPVDRVGTAEEIAAAVAFLASDEATYLTGQSLRVDGGLTRSI